MSVDAELTTTFRILHALFGGVGSILNLILLLLALFQSPKVIRLYATLIVNFAITDLLACLLDIFIEIRVLPYPNEDSMAHVMNGFCKYFGLTTCAVGFSLYLHTLTHSIWSLLISFGYRYLILFKISLKRKTIILVILAFYFPSFLQGVTYWSNLVERYEMMPIVRRVHPDYDFSENIGLLTGITDLYTPSVVYGMLHTTLQVTPVYISIFIIRWKTVKILTKNRESMSKETKTLHTQLLRVLTLQAVLPSTSFFTTYLFMGLKFGLLSGQIYEHLVFSIAMFVPVVSPITYIVFIKPYRLFFIRKFCKKCCKSVIQERTQTRMYSQHDQSSSGNRK